MAADEPPLAELASGEGSAAVGSSPSSEALSRLLFEFNLSEFLALANRVIDEGDLSSMEIIADLNRRWTERFGDSHSRPSMDVRPSSSRTLAPFQSITVPCRPARWIPRLPTSEQMRVYLEPPPAVSHFPVPLLALPPPSTMAAPPSELNLAVATLAPPSDCTKLESSLQDPDLFPPSIPDAPPSLQDSPPSKRVECQPQSSIENQPQYSMFSMDRTTPQDAALLRPSIHGVPPSLHGDKPSKRVECQPQSSIKSQPQYAMFSMDRSTLQDPALLRPSIHGVPPSLHGDKPSKRVECQPQSSIESQPQYSMFSMDRTTP
ncbi:hypothetical protein Salat_1119700 [Sesamum alatum]|uniref:Uncharacterized protein n=1 Tax=Sesamum alatum TaxID=300844 RepID=A0AAE1YPU9_9LAMI|nr:hypothetical protein Salat_1119700 [Sesamum alatum]